MRLGLSLGITSQNTPSRPALTVNGSGYSGSEIISSHTGQWFADGVALAGQSGSSLTMTPLLEGSEIWLATPEGARSNTVQFFAPKLLSTELKLNGGQWGADIQQTVTREGLDYVTAWPDRFGQRHMSQTAAANQPRSMLIAGHPAASWGAETGSDKGFSPAETFEARWFFIMATYKNGAASFSGYPSAIIGNRDTLYARIAGQTGTASFMTQAQSGAINLRANGSDTVSHLPLLRGSLSATIPPELTNANRLWHIGRAWRLGESVKRDWDGEIYAVLALTNEPNLQIRQAIEGYYHWKYDSQSLLPLNHPFRSTPPRLQ